MKNFFKLFGIIAIVAVIGFSMTACDDGSDSGGGGNPLLGTWYNPQYQEAIKFLDSNVQICEGVQNIQTAIFENYGTYTVQGNNVTITLTTKWRNELGVQQETYLFSVSGASLNLSSTGDGWITGEYTKQ